MSDLFVPVTHAELVKQAVKWLQQQCKNATPAGHGQCHPVISELSSFALEIPDAIGWYYSRSFLVECKVSRSDFFADQKKFTRQDPSRGMGDYRYFLTPSGLIRPDELPEKWGLIEFDGRRRKVIKFSERHPANKLDEIQILRSALSRVYRGHDLKGKLSMPYAPTYFRYDPNPKEPSDSPALLSRSRSSESIAEYL